MSTAHSSLTHLRLERPAPGVARLVLDNIPHIKAYWVMLTPRIAQIALRFGAADGAVELLELVPLGAAKLVSWHRYET